MSLLELPLEIILLLPEHLDSIQTLLRLRSTCKALHIALENPTINNVLWLAIQSGDRLVRHSCHHEAHSILAVVVAKQVADWAIGNEERTATLVSGFSQGAVGILEVAMHSGVAGMTLDDLKYVFTSHSGPAFALAGIMRFVKQIVPDDRHSGIPNGAFFIRDMVYHIAIYGQLFQSTLVAGITSDDTMARFSISVRRAYLTQWDRSLEPSALLNTGAQPNLLFKGWREMHRRLTVGKRFYAGNNQLANGRKCREDYSNSRNAMLSLFSNCAWQYRWRAVLHEAELLNNQSSYDEDLLWTTTVLNLGLDGLQMWLPPPTCEERDTSNLLINESNAIDTIRQYVQRQETLDMTEWGTDSWPNIYMELWNIELADQEEDLPAYTANAQQAKSAIAA